MMKRFYFTLVGVCLGMVAWASDFNVLEFGASGQGDKLESPAINAAIEAAAKNGGGRVVVPAGKYLCGSIRMKSFVELHLMTGATIVAVKDKTAYDPAESDVKVPYQDRGHTYFENSLIWGKNLRNVSITGRGIIDGKNLYRDWKFGAGADDQANKTIALYCCNDVLIRDITILHGGWFGIILTGCNLVSLNNLLIDTNRDGIDIDCCTNVTVSDCKVNSPMDDGICLKSSYALGRKVVTENVSITNCQVSGFQEGTLYDGRMIPQEIEKKNLRVGRIKFGTESNGGFRNCVVSNCTFRNCRGLALESVDGGVMENITVSNLSMYDVDTYPIYITLGERLRDPDTSGTSVGRHILISDVVAHTSDSISGIHITGTPRFMLEDIRLENITICYRGGVRQGTFQKDYPELGKNYPEINTKRLVPAYGLFVRHVKGLELRDVTLKFQEEDERPAAMLVDIDGLRVDNVRAQVSDQSEGIVHDRIRNLSVVDSPLFEKIANDL